MDRSKLLQGTSSVSLSGLAYIKSNKEEAVTTIAELLYRYCDKKTCLFISGGSTPKPLYERLSIDGKLNVGAIAMIDERYGEKFHEKSNEKMINETYLTNLTNSFYPVLKERETSIEQTTVDYDETLRYLFNYFPKTIGILGIGDDGHTAGIPAIPEIARKIEEDKSAYAASYDDEGKYGKRVTMTYNSLARLDLIIILVFGNEKRKALREMFKEGDLSRIPARFYLEEGMLGKTILVSDLSLQ